MDSCLLRFNFFLIVKFSNPDPKNDPILAVSDSPTAPLAITVSISSTVSIFTSASASLSLPDF